MKIGFINIKEYKYEINFNFIEVKENINLQILNKIDKFQDFDYILLFVNNILYLKDFNSKLPVICCDFEDKSLNYRLSTTNKNQDILKACGFNKKDKLTIVDATAGLGKDSFIFANYGANIFMIEQNPLIYTILNDGLKRGQNSNNELIQKACKNMSLYNDDSINFLSNTNIKPNCIYLDTMFPKTNKTSLVKKEMQVFHNLAYYGDNEALFNISLKKTINRVVVKRMLNSPLLIDKKPNYSINGNTIRFDIYLNNFNK